MNKPANESPLFYNDDTPETVELIHGLIRRKYFTQRPSKSHIKVGPVNFWPTTGTISVDGRGRAVEKGADFLMQILAKHFPPKITHTYKRRIPRST
jgi:hypothetical protein